jgi:hypothetical protein
LVDRLRNIGVHRLLVKIRPADEATVSRQIADAMAAAA